MENIGQENKDPEKEENKEMKYSEGIKKVSDFFKQKKVQNILVIIALISIIFLGVFIRIQNLDLLTDSTTGEKIPLALDPYYFLRVAETIQATDGNLPELDPMRNFEKGWTLEILPYSSIAIQKTVNLFNNEFTLRDAHVLNPVIFFVLGAIVFFFLVFSLTNSRLAAFLGTGFLVIVPSYLYRTMAGFADHESIGMFAFFLLLLGFSYSLKYLNNNFNKTKNKVLVKKYLFGVLVGFLMAFTITSWGGIAKFSFMIIPLAVLVFWFVKRRQKEIEKLKDIPVYYFLTLLASIIFTPLISGHSAFGVINKYILSSSGLISAFVLGFLIVDFLVIYLNNKKIIRVKEKYEILYSLGVIILLGFVFVVITGQLSLITDIFDRVLNPFGGGRVGETVAENRSPSLEDWINNTGTVFFWIFILGMLLVGREISKKISKDRLRRIGFLGFWSIMVLGIIFSSHSSLNALGFFKQVIYFASVIAFFGYIIWLYEKEGSEGFKIKPELIIIFSWMIFMLVAARGAIRLFFVITPFVCFMTGYAPVKLFEIAKKSKDELMKIILWILLGIIVISLVISISGFYSASMQQSSNTGPSAHSQWQQAMKWVRENTPQDSLFLHWWDYGYWIQTLGNRATIVDGGYHPQRVVHMIGRYVLTTPNPDSALSFMKSRDADYLVIDPTDIGKYSAYSRIGSGPEMKDRLSYIPTFQQDPEQTVERRNETIRVYRGGFGLDKDLAYEQENGNQIFLPRQEAALGAIVLKTKKNPNQSSQEISFNQPEGIFIYKQQQFRIPIKNIYYDGEMYEFESGINSTIRVIPSASYSQEGLNIKPLGATMYLSRKVSQSLVAQLYLMDDPYNKYYSEGLELAHEQQDQVVSILKMQGAPVDDFVNYRGLRGPIKIWKIGNISDEIITHEEFTQVNPRGDDWEYGILDELKFREE